jgi:Spy/CpxP family protein refolding chaperone
MRIIKTSLMAALALAGVLTWQTTTFAADTDTAGKARRDQVRDRVQQVAKELNLTPEQKEKIKPILQEMRQSARAIAQDKSLSREEKKTKLKALREEFAPKLKEILTPEQLEKWNHLRQEKQGKRKAGA